MARFYVGQRVRIAWVHHAVEIEGRQGVILELNRQAKNLSRPRGPEYWTGHLVHVDGYPARFPNGDPRYVLSPAQLEPIQPEGWKPVAWSECLWQPEGVSA